MHDYGDLGAGKLRRFKARDPDNPERLGTGLVHPDGSAAIQWWNVKAAGGEGVLEMSLADEAAWRPYFVEWDERGGSSEY